MAHDPHEQETREVNALPADEALTPKRGTPSVRKSDQLRQTRGLSRKHWSGARFVALVILLVLAALALFFAFKNLL